MPLGPIRRITAIAASAGMLIPDGKPAPLARSGVAPLTCYP